MSLYHRRFLDSHSAENVLGLFTCNKGSAKEITESWGMLEAARRFVPDLGAKHVIVVGDGCTPRTGALFAYYTKALVVSIDPQLSYVKYARWEHAQTAMGYPPQRLHLAAQLVEELEWDCQGADVVFVWPHSHADMDATKGVTNYGRRYDIALPCCVPPPNAWLSRPHVHYEDFHIASVKRGVYVWGVEGLEKTK